MVADIDCFIHRIHTHPFHGSFSCGLGAILNDPCPLLQPTRIKLKTGKIFEVVLQAFFRTAFRSSFTSNFFSDTKRRSAHIPLRMSVHYVYPQSLISFCCGRAAIPNHQALAPFSCEPASSPPEGSSSLFAPRQGGPEFHQIFPHELVGV